MGLINKILSFFQLEVEDTENVYSFDITKSQAKLLLEAMNNMTPTEDQLEDYDKIKFILKIINPE